MKMHYAFARESRVLRCILYKISEMELIVDRGPRPRHSIPGRRARATPGSIS